MAENSSSTKEVKVYLTRVVMRTEYEVPIKATDPEQAAQWAEKNFKHGMDCPDERYYIDSDLDSVDESEPDDSYLPEEAPYDATKFDFEPR